MSSIRRNAGRASVFVAFIVFSALAAVSLRSQANAGAAVVGDSSTAGYNDLVVTADGTLHAIWQDRPQNGRRYTVFHRSSRDGMRWSTPIDLDPAEATASTVRAAVDGAGRVYAIWKSRAPAMTTPELNATNSMNASHGTLVYRVLEAGRWSSTSRLGRRNCVYGWFVDVGPDGLVQVVWSEAPNGDPDSAFDALADATTVQRARLDGATSRSERLFDAPTGLYGLHGYVDAADRPHFAALGHDDRLLHFDGRRLASIVDDYRPRERRDAPKLLRDRSGADHVIAYANGNVIDLRPGGGRGVIPRPAGPAIPIEDVQTAQARDGRMFVAVALKDATAADFIVTWSDDGQWARPVSLTGTGESVRGVITSNGLGFSSTSRVLGIFASMAIEPSGALGVLLTAGVARMNNSRQWDGGYSIGSFEPKVFFGRVSIPGSVYVAPPAVRPQAPPQPSRPPSVPTQVATPRPMPTATPVPPPTPAAAPVSLPAGRYACDRLSQYAGPLPSGLAVVIREDRYEIAGVGSGVLTGTGTAVRWTSGPLAAPQARTAVVEKNGAPIVRFIWEGDTHECTMRR